MTRAAPDDQRGVGKIIAVNMAVGNGIREKASLYNAELDYVVVLSGGTTLEAHTSALYQPSRMVQYREGTGPVDQLAISANAALKLRLMNEISASWRKVTLGVRTHYFDRYLASPVRALQLNEEAWVPRQMYHDLYGRVQFFPDGAVSEVQIEAGIRNLFHKEPPFDAGNTAAYYSTLGDPRVSTYYLMLRASLGDGRARQ